MLKQGEMSVVDYEREFSRLSRYAIELVPTEIDKCKRFLHGLRDQLQVQLVSHRITEFADLDERARMVEQVLGFDKKNENTRTVEKHSKAASSNPQPKRSKEFCGSQRSNFKSDRADRNCDRQPTMSTGSVRGPSRDTDIPNCEHCMKKHRGECQKLTRGYFHCGSTEHFVRDCSKNDNATPVTSQRSMPASKGHGSSRSGSFSRGGTGKGMMLLLISRRPERQHELMLR